MTEIIIKKNGKVYEVWFEGSIQFSGGRVAAKQRAKSLHISTGNPVFKLKQSGSKVAVNYQTL